MSKLIDAFEKQANEIKANKELLKVAEQYKAAAQVLFEKANKPVLIDHKLLAKNKQAKFEEFTKAVGIVKFSEIDGLMLAHGWKPVPTTRQITRCYVNEKHLGFYCDVKGTKFSIRDSNGNAVVSDIYLRSDGKFVDVGKFIKQEVDSKLEKGVQAFANKNRLSLRQSAFGQLKNAGWLIDPTGANDHGTVYFINPRHETTSVRITNQDRFFVRKNNLPIATDAPLNELEACLKNLK